jgi:DNA-binding Lrp family transcriptional regulator
MQVRVMTRAMGSGENDDPGQRLSTLEQDIVRHVQDDGRMPFVDIARRLGIPEAKVRRTISRLLERDVIAITAVADPRLVGLSAMAVVGTYVDWGKATRNLQNQLLEIRGVDYVATTSGRFQVMAEVMARDLVDLGSRVDHIRGVDGVVSTETFVYLDLLHQDFRWSTTTESDGSNPGVDAISELERRLILALCQDGRRSFRQIARDLDVSLQRVVSAYRRLSKDHILRVMAVINPARLGMETMAWLGIRVRSGAAVEEVAAILADVSVVDYVVICTGRFDLLVEVACTAPGHLAEVLETRLGAATGVSTVEVFTYLRLDYPSERVWSAGRVSALNL